MTMRRVRPPLRSASRTTSPPLDGGEETQRQVPSDLPLPPSGGEVARRDGAGGGTGARSRRPPGATARARNLRKAGNEAEALLWLELKQRRLAGFKFTRQLPIGPYFADFACRERRLVVEIDGSQHADSTHDRHRDELLRRAGYSVLRFWNVDVFKQRAAVCETILAVLLDRLDESVVAPDLRFVRGSLPSPTKTDSTP